MYYFRRVKTKLNILLKEIVEKEGENESLAVSGDHSFMEAPIYNSLGYLHYWVGEKEKSKEYFEKYIDVYPYGYNSYDSMGEWYFNEKDYESALTYYKKAREINPRAMSANNKIRTINQMNK